MMKPYRNTDNGMTFDKADGIARRNKKELEEFFHECYVKLFHYGKEDEAFRFEMIRDHLREGGTLDPKQAARIIG
ncbi:MAG: hypothetical protein EBW86_08865, partial [Rhodobacteraceae bacterium]|nr:hypothetical protein [Paracoccaceae bacterium]